jgi:CheY-like chemotaxis protein
LRLPIRAKLGIVVGTMAVAFVVLLSASQLLTLRQRTYLTDVESRLVPKLELAPRIESDFQRLTQSMQDAVEAQDGAALESSLDAKDRLIALVAQSEAVLEAGEGAALRHAITAYHAAAYEVSRQLLRGEAGEATVQAIADMQAKQKRTQALIRKAAGLDRRELEAGFDGIRSSALTASRLHFGVGFASLVVVLLLVAWLSRGIIKAMREISLGFSRYEQGDFTTPIPILTTDEFARISREANRMAEGLSRLHEKRLATDWLNEGVVGLLDRLRNEQSPAATARSAVTYLAERVGAAAGALYLSDGKGTLRLAGSYAHAGHQVDPTPAFGVGEALVGEAAVKDRVQVVRDLPPGYFSVRSALGEIVPEAILLVPLSRPESVIGVLELSVLGSDIERARELLSSVREPLSIILEQANARAALTELLEQTLEQADRLAAQEEELRHNNRELSMQQEELRRANDELESQRAALSTQNVELEQARSGLQKKAEELARVSSYKSQFLANMSHELRTPLNSMLLLSQLLAENDSGHLDEKEVEQLRTIHSAGRDLLGLINQVLDLARIESGRQELDVAPVDPREIADQLRRVFSPLAKDKELRLLIEVDDDVPKSIVSDRHRLERILTNLLGNGVKFTNRGEVTLRVRRARAQGFPTREGLSPNTSLAFVVSDTGIGIPPDALERVFAPFEQVESRPDRRYGGSGLGLAIARESALLLGGDLVLESEVGRGSTFTCYVPFEPPGAQPGARRAPVAAPRDDESTLTTGETSLLIIEDDAVFGEQLVNIIHKRGFKALVATTGERGIELARERHPAGIILDVHLPDIDGWTVIERLRADARTRSIPVHFVSAIDAPERGLALGAVGYLTKPVTLDELIGVVQSLMRPTETKHPILVVEDIVSQGESLVALLGRASIPASHVASASEALAALERERHACMILDLGLPDMDGLMLLEELEKRAIASPPVVVHTARSLTRDERRRLETYCQAIVVKDGHSEQRLLDEARLFVQHLHEKLPQKPTALAAAPPLPGDRSLAGVKLLLADDDMRTVYALSALLRGKGAEVVVAENGREALEQLAAHRNVSCVLMDVMMPEMDGYEATRRLRADPRFAALPVIALTAKAMKGERERCLEAGASDYLAKPVDSSQLLATLAKWIAEGAHA